MQKADSYEKVKKILFVVPRMGGGGTERVISLLSAEFIKDGKDVTVHTFIGGESFYNLDSEIKVSDCGIKISKKPIRRALGMLFKFPKTFFRTRKVIKKGGYDLVFSFLATADIIVWLCKKTGLKFKHVCSERNDPTHKGKALIRTLKKVYKKADMFVCQSEDVKNFYKCVAESKKAVIPNSVNPDIIPARVKSDEKTVVAVGRLDGQKNFGLLIDAFSDLGEEFGEYKLNIYGEGKRRAELEAQIENLGLSEKVTLCGAKKGLLDIIKTADLFVMSSDYEGFPNALLEAKAIGLPLVSTDFKTGTAKEIIAADGGTLVPVGDRTALKEAIERALSSEELRDKESEFNRKDAEKFYNENVIKKWIFAIDEIIYKKAENGN